MICSYAVIAGRLQHLLFFFFNDTATTEIYTFSLHDALPISRQKHQAKHAAAVQWNVPHVLVGDISAERSILRVQQGRSEEHTSELQSPCNLVCRLLLEKKNNSRP